MKKRSRFLWSFLGLLVSLGLAGFALPEDSTNPRPRTFEERLDAIEAKLSELETRVNHIQPSQRLQ
jgi:hypothetical protein